MSLSRIVLKCAALLFLLAAFEVRAIPPELQNLSYGVYPTSSSYDTDRFNFNKRWNVFPQAIFYPTTQAEIIFVLNSLTNNSLPFSVRCAGHCYQNGSLSTGYIVDVSQFNTITPDLVTEQVVIGAGCRLNAVSDVLGALNYAIPFGTCPTNGISGFSLGGGIGYLGRTYGMACDSVVNITLLTANGSVIDVNATSYPDLFWALRGGGNGSFGIALAFTYQMYYVPTLSYYELQWNWDPNVFPDVFATWQKWVQSLPSTISTTVTLAYENGAATYMISGMKTNGDPFTEWNVFQPYNPKVTITQGSFNATKSIWLGEPDQPFNKGKSKILMDPISTAGINVIVENVQALLKEQPPLLISFDFESYGGAIRNSNSAFFPKNAFGWLYQSYYWTDESYAPLALGYSKLFFDAISPYVSVYSYPNTVDYDLGPYYMNAYYGDNAAQLIQVKQKYDPNNIFQWAQSIPLSPVIPGSLIPL